MHGCCIDQLMQQTERNAHLFSFAVNWPWLIFQNTEIDMRGTAKQTVWNETTTTQGCKWSEVWWKQSLHWTHNWWAEKMCRMWEESSEKMHEVQCIVACLVFWTISHQMIGATWHLGGIKLMNFTSKAFPTCISKLYCFGIQLALQTNWHSTLWYKGFTCHL